MSCLPSYSIRYWVWAGFTALVKHSFCTEHPSHFLLLYMFMPHSRSAGFSQIVTFLVVLSIHPCLALFSAAGADPEQFKDHGLPLVITKLHPRGCFWIRSADCQSSMGFHSGVYFTHSGESWAADCYYMGASPSSHDLCRPHLGGVGGIDSFWVHLLVLYRPLLQPKVCFSNLPEVVVADMYTVLRSFSLLVCCILLSRTRSFGSTLTLILLFSNSVGAASKRLVLHLPIY